MPVPDALPGPADSFQPTDFGKKSGMVGSRQSEILAITSGHMTLKMPTLLPEITGIHTKS